ncbi:MAG: Methyltransferase type 12, partial [Bryobacterales bacterium]|nr:Methyltransferase type 12 [Bryobacterales bacterium]
MGPAWESPLVKVFLSSTADDLQPHRELVRSVIYDYDLTFLGMENFGAQPLPPIDVCLRYVEQCDVMVCLLGTRYGTRVDGQLSYV